MKYRIVHDESATKYKYKVIKDPEGDAEEIGKAETCEAALELLNTMINGE